MVFLLLSFKKMHFTGNTRSMSLRNYLNDQNCKSALIAVLKLFMEVTGEKLLQIRAIKLSNVKYSLRKEANL